jgi:hypothetical protein
MKRCRRRLLGRRRGVSGTKDLVNASSKVVASRGTTRSRRTCVDFDATGLFLSLEGVTECALIGGADAYGETGQETLLVKDGAFVEEMRLADTAKHAVSKLRSFTVELMNNSGHVFIQSGLEFGIIVGICLFTKSIDATLKRSTTPAKSRRALPLSIG